MNLQTRPREQPEVNLTSLIDVVLLLLIFFMISTSFVQESELRINLPEASAEPAIATSAPKLEIAVTAQGDYRVNGKELINRQPDTLRRAIKDAVGARRNFPITLRADAQTTHQAVVIAMDVAGKLGFEQVNIVTVNDQD